MNTDFEVLNFLNLTNSRLGKLYKLTGYNPLPEGFVLSKKIIKEKLLLGQLQCEKLPDFVFESKKELKKRLKASLKNIKKTLKNAKVEGIDAEFVAKMDFYFNVRREVTDAILKDFNKVNFDECDAYLEIYAIDPLFADLLPDLFEDNFNISKINPELEVQYEQLKKLRLKTLEKKETKKRKTTQLQHEMVRKNVKTIQKTNQKTKKKENKKEEQPVATKKQERKSKEKA